MSGLSCSTQDLSLQHLSILLQCAVFSLVVARRLSYPVTCGILVPGPEIEPESPALQGRCLTNGPQGKPYSTDSVCLENTDNTPLDSFLGKWSSGSFR